MVDSLREALLEGLFPEHCELCGLRSYRPLPLCEPCAGELVPNSHCCPRCAVPLAANVAPGTPCGQCQRRPPPFERTVAPWVYEVRLAHIIGRWKFHGERRLSRLLAALWWQARPKPGEVDLVLPVPLHWRRLWRRGFNQSYLFAEALRRGGDAGAIEHRLVRRARATPAQSGTTARRQREANLRGAFTVRGRCDNLRVAVVDDVMTTGATAAALAQALKGAGAAGVEIWCLARTPPR